MVPHDYATARSGFFNECLADFRDHYSRVQSHSALANRTPEEFCDAQ